MRGKPPALPLTVSKRQREILEREFRKVKTPEFLKKRVGIIINGLKGVSNSQSAREFRITTATVRTWRNRWQSSYDELCAFEMEQRDRPISDHKLFQKIQEILSDNPRSGAPKRITLAERQQIVALACENPGMHGIPFTNWTHEMLAHVVVAKGIVDKISSSHIGNILKKTN